MVTGVDGDHGVLVAINADLESKTEQGSAMTLLQKMEEKHALEIPCLTKIA